MLQLVASVLHDASMQTVNKRVARHDVLIQANANALLGCKHVTHALLFLLVVQWTSACLPERAALSQAQMKQLQPCWFWQTSQA